MENAFRSILPLSDVISALMTTCPSVNCCLYTQIWEGRAITFACFSEAIKTNCRSSGVSVETFCALKDGDIRLFDNLTLSESARDKKKNVKNKVRQKTALSGGD